MSLVRQCYEMIAYVEKVEGETMPNGHAQEIAEHLWEDKLKLEERIRELEMQRNDIGRGANEFANRIQKAREILHIHHEHSRYRVEQCFVCQALEALLEGK